MTTDICRRTVEYYRTTFVKIQQITSTYEVLTRDFADAKKRNIYQRYQD